MTGEPTLERLPAAGGPVPPAGFTVDGYAGQLARMHRRIRSRGPFVSHAQRFLIEACKPR
jgi:hypothetical protein